MYIINMRQDSEKQIGQIEKGPTSDDGILATSWAGNGVRGNRGDGDRWMLTNSECDKRRC